MMDNKSVSKYAFALFLLAKEKGLVQKIEKDLFFINDVFKNHPFLKNILLYPNIEKDKKRKLLGEVFSQMSKESINFLKLLLQESRIKDIEEIFEQYKLFCQEFYGSVEALVFSASPLADSEREMLSKVMEDATNKKIVIKERIDKDLLGGLRIEYSGKVYDWTVKTRLQRIEESLNYEG